MRSTAVVMAGGRGERFWPRSRAACPKQFLSLTKDGKTMLQLTVERLLPVVGADDIFIATGEAYRDIVQEQLPRIPAKNILCEPVAKNTAPCIAYAAAVIAARYGDAVMHVVSSDHIIQNSALFADTLRLADEVARQDENIVTLGITPGYPETGYGYLRFDAAPLRDGVYPVAQFVEKPDLATAQGYLEAGCYLWNSGMFVWKATTFLHNCEKHLPQLYNAAANILAAEQQGGVSDAGLLAAFEAMPSVSVDYGIMEKAQHIYTIPCSFGWDDVGSWLSLGRINEADEAGNVALGEVLSLDNSGCVFVSGGRLVAAVGLEDMVVVETADSVLVCKKQDSQRVKELVEQLKNTDRFDYI